MDGRGTLTRSAGRATEERQASARLVRFGLPFLLLPLLAPLFLRPELPPVDVGWREGTLFALLVALRAVRVLRHRRLLDPIVDLPLIGLSFVFTGGPESPLDPTLFFVYALVAFLWDRRARGARGLAPYLVGMVATYALVLWNSWEGDRSVEREQRSVLEARAAELRSILGQIRFDGEALGAGFAGGDLDVLRTALADRDRVLARVVGSLGADIGSGQALALREELAAVFPRTDETFEAAQAAAGDVEAGGALLRRKGRLPRAVLEEAEAWRRQQEELRAGVDDFLDAVLEEAERLDERHSAFVRLAAERTAMILLVALTLALVGALRSDFERTVERRESERTRREVDAKRRETENWIALTAGLTHSIGNDILAYEAVTTEALEALDDGVVEVARENLEFIRESNSARLAFVRFLGEFARMRKEREEGGAVRLGRLERVDLVDLCRRVRARVGRIEAADLPRDVDDPVVEAQRAKLLDLPLEVDVAPGVDPVLPAAQRGVLEFFLYELFKNALRHVTGRTPLRVEIERRHGTVRLRVVNDLEVRERKDDRGRVLLSLPRRPDLGEWTEEDFAERLERALEASFAPGRGGGTGLGLFLIRYFARETYGGSVRARVVDASRRLVAFEIEFPADLEAMRR